MPEYAKIPYMALRFDAPEDQTLQLAVPQQVLEMTGVVRAIEIQVDEKLNCS